MRTHSPDRASGQDTPRRRGDSSARSRASRTRSSSATTTSAALALVGIHTRGVPLAQRLRRAVAERSGAELELGAVDITFHRDDVLVRGGAPRRTQPVVRATDARLPARGDDRACSSTTSSTRAARSAPRSTRCSSTAGPARVQLAVLVDRGHRELPIRPDYVGKNLPTARERARPGRARRGRRGRPRPARRREPEDDATSEPRLPRRRGGTCSRSPTSTRDDVERLLDTARALAAVARPRGEEAADAARPARRQPLLRVVDAHARRASSSPRSGSRPTRCRSGRRARRSTRASRSRTRR